MEPIVSPWFVYALGVVDGVRTLWLIVGALTCVAGIIAAIVAGERWGSRGYSWENSEKCIAASRKYKRVSLYVLPAGIIILFLGLLIPSNKTMMAMYAASMTTPDNISAVIGAGKNFKDEIKQDILDILERGVERKGD